MVAQLKKYCEIVFSSFWHDLGFGGSFFLVRIQFKKYLKIDFSSFWKDLAWFLFKISFTKVFKNWFFQLLARSWFWRQLFSIQHLIKKVFKIRFLRLLFPNISKCEISHSLFAKEVAQTLFLIFLLHASYEQKKGIYINSSRKVFKNWFPHLLARSWFWQQLFSIQHWMKKVFKIDFSGFCSHDEKIDGTNISKCEMAAQQKKFKHWFFPAFGTIMVLVAAFF